MVINPACSIRVSSVFNPWLGFIVPQGRERLLQRQALGRDLLAHGRSRIGVVLGWYEKDAAKTLELLNRIPNWETSAVLLPGAGTSGLVEELSEHLGSSFKLISHFEDAYISPRGDPRPCVYALYKREM